jgi:hypothetical protein
MLRILKSVIKDGDEGISTYCGSILFEKGYDYQPYVIIEPGISVLMYIARILQLLKSEDLIWQLKLFSRSIS